MRVSVFCGTSVDGFLARPDDIFDFLKAGEGVPHGFVEFLRSVDVVVMGRRTFEVVRGLGHFELYGKKPLIVLSSRPLDLSSIQGSNKQTKIEQMAGTPQEIIKQLEARGFRHMYLDGGITIQRFLKEGLVDRIIVTRVPVLIGQGVPLFGPLLHDVALRHVTTRSYKGGLVQSKYVIDHPERRVAMKKPRHVPGKKRSY